MIYILENHKSGGFSEEAENKLKAHFEGEEIKLLDVCEVESKKDLLSGITEEDKLVIFGGDGTLNHFINETEPEDYRFPIYAFAGGTGNDFAHDVAKEGEDFILINDYLRDLPSVTVNGKKYRFINGVGYGIDGYCCEKGDEYREKTGKAPNYTKIAIGGLFGGYHKVNAKVTIDGVTTEYKNVWLAPTMNGRYYGGGMMITPEQDRLNPERELSVCVATAWNPLSILLLFPSIFKGEHVKNKKIVKTFKGKSVKVEFDRPTALQIDGETVLGVTAYEARSYALEKEAETV